MSNTMNVLMNNTVAMFSNRQLGITNANKAKSTNKLSSGYKINRAADDAAGLTISEKMRHKIRSLNQGVNNIQDGVSVCQVADGALTESQDILQRINQLSIKSANDTNTPEERDAIQSEVTHLKEELDRISKTTSFNEKIFPLSGGKESELILPGDKVSFDNVDISKWENTDVSMLKWPFTAESGPTEMKLTAEIDGTGTAIDGSIYNLIYGNGSTSYPSVVLGYTVPGSEDINFARIPFSNMAVDKDSVTLDEESQTLSRTLKYTDGDNGLLSFDVKQSVTLNSDEKSYTIKNTLTNNSESQITSYMFLQNYDTAYSNNDHVEGYYTDSNKLTNESLWVSEPDLLFVTKLAELGLDKDHGLLKTATQAMLGKRDLNQIPSSISIANTEDHMLPFSEKISFGSDQQGFLAVGLWNTGRGDNGGFVNNYDTTNKASLQNGDISFTYASFGDSSLTYGVENIFEDSNIDSSDIKSSDYHIKKYDDIWIQYSDVNEDGMFIDCVDASCAGLGMGSVNLSTIDGAKAAIDTTQKALATVSKYRSNFGASQNRLEHRYSINKNTSENTQAAESRIRDTDMAAEMVQNAKYNILEQAGQSMLAQANQQRQGILSLLQ